MSAVSRSHSPIDREARAAVVVAAGLSKRFGDRAAVDGLSFHVPPAAVTGFIGPNGAGKTTTLRMLLGLARPSGGTAQVLGHSIANPAAYMSSVGALTEGPAFYPNLSAHRNLTPPTVEG